MSLCRVLSADSDTYWLLRRPGSPQKQTVTPANLSTAYSFSHSPRQTGRGRGTGILIAPWWSCQVLPMDHLPRSAFEFYAVSVTLPLVHWVDLPCTTSTESSHSSQRTLLLVQALVISHLDYCNSLLAGLPVCATKPPCFNLPKFSHVTPLLRDLYCPHPIQNDVTGLQGQQWNCTRLPPNSGQTTRPLLYYISWLAGTASAESKQSSLRKVAT